MTRPPEVIPAESARRLFLHAQGLTDDVAAQPPATPRRLARLVERIGFVQVDTISTVDRAHHLILAARLNGYRPAMLTSALERDRSLFEHWTHDASIIPATWYAHWRARFARHALKAWHRERLGDDADATVAAVLERITREGPLTSADFAHDGPPRGGWWDWKPAKAALEFLWRSGRLHVVGRRNFQKVYDLTERAVPNHGEIATPTEADHVAWACRTALDRLGIATAREVAQFWAAISVRQAESWLANAVKSGEAIPVVIESADGSPTRLAYAPPDVHKRIRRLGDPPPGVRLLCPFDPVLRDRSRARRLFGFDFRFEGFVPAARRTHGYYVMAILDADRFVGRCDPKFDRRTGTLHVRRVTWEPGVRATRRQSRSLESGLERLAGWIGATNVEIG